MSDGPIVLKIGGSLVKSGGLLERVLSLAGQARRGVAIVPGGGPFADAVRLAQKQIGFDDEAAHQMAILGMHQMGLLLTALGPGLRACEDLEEIEAGLRGGETLVWLPLKECEGDAELPRSWETTSDAIAARLAQRLGGLKVVFVKSRATGSAGGADALAAEGLIDAVAARIIKDAGLAFETIAADEEARLCKILGMSMQVDVPPTTC